MSEEHWLPEDLQGNPSLEKFESAADLAKSYMELESYQGSSIRIPGEDAGEEDINAFHEKLIERVPGLTRSPDFENEEVLLQYQRQMGAPEDAEGYSVPEMDLQGLDLNDNLVSSFRGLAAANGLTQKQFEGIVKGFTENNVKEVLELQGKRNEEQVALKTEWGGAHDERIQQITRFAEASNAPASLTNALKAGQFEAGTARWLYSLMTQMSGEAKNFDLSQQQSTITPAEAQDQINEIFNNREHPYWDRSKAGHEQAQKKVRELYKIIEPGTDQSGVGTVGVGGQIEFR